MSYQIPKATHPWRNYADKKSVRENSPVKPLRVLIMEISESWDRIEVTGENGTHDRRYGLIDLPQRKQAEWVINLLKKYTYMATGKDYEDEED